MPTTNVSSGVTTSGAILNGGDILKVLSGGATIATTINSGGQELVSFGGTASGGIINTGGNESVDGTVLDTTVNSGGAEVLYTGAAASGTVVNAGGAQFVKNGAVTDHASINAGGDIYVDGRANNTTVHTGGTESVYSGIAVGTIVESGGSEVVNAGGTTNGATVSGSMTVLSAGTANAVTIATSGSVFLKAGALTSGGILFNGGHAKLDIDGTKMPTTTIGGMAISDEIDLGGLVYGSSNTVSVSGDHVTLTGTGGASETLAIAGAQSDVFGLSVETDGDGGTRLVVMSVTGNPVVSSPTVTVAENAAAAAIGIATPTDPHYATAQLTITVGGLPTDGTVTLADGTTAVTAGQVMSSAQLTSLLFTPTQGAFGASSTFTYTVADPAANSSSGVATLAIGPAVGNPSVSSPSITVAENAAATAIGIVAPTDPNYAASQLTITVGGLPADGTVTLADGVTAITAGQALTSVQLIGLTFTPTSGRFGTSSAFTYTATDPAGNSTAGSATLAIGPAIGNPVVSSPVLTVTENAPATAIGITTPTDPNYAASQLAITVGGLPADGTVTLADGVTAVIAGQVLTVDQLTGLMFTSATGQFGASSAFIYTVADPAGNSTAGSATLAIGPAIGNPVVSSPVLTVTENAPATAIGITAPTDPNYAASQLTITVGGLPADGTVTLADGTTAVMAGQVLTVDQLAGLMFTSATGQFGASSAFSYTVADPAGNSTAGSVTLAIGPAIGNPVVSSPALTVAENAPATAIGIAAPTDPNYAATQLTITAGGLPNDGTVTLADGVTSVTIGQNLTVDQLTSLLFTPAIGQFDANSTFTYSVTDPAGNTGMGAVALGIGSATPVSPVTPVDPVTPVEPVTPVGSGFINTGADSTIDGSMANAALMKAWAHYDLYLASNITNDGANISITSLDGNGDVAVYSTADSSGHSLSASGTGRSVIAAGGGHDTITLSNGTDLLATGVGANTVHLQSGDNQLRSEGNDTIDVGTGNDQIELGGSSVIYAGDATLLITVDAGASLALHTGAASVQVQGGYGGGAFSGGTAGHNLLVAGTSATTLYAGGDGDVLVASGGTGTTMYGWGGHETMDGRWSQGANVYNADGADVTMLGGAGTNVFNLGTGHASIVAELGTDLFNFVKGNASATYIEGFKVGTDTAHLSGFGADEVSQALATASVYQGSETLTLRDGSNITFGNVTGLTQSSFV